MKFERSKNRISLNKRISMKCLDCSGGSPKEVTLCHLFSCPLWAMRTGLTLQSKTYQKRMEKAKEQFVEEFKELVNLGIKYSDFLVEHNITVIPE